MKYIIGNNRNQMSLFCLEEYIAQDNEVRLVDLFVDSLPLSDYNFEQKRDLALGGRPAYHPSDLLKLFNYNQKKIERHLAYIEAKLEEYNAILGHGMKALFLL